jgi:hypothetical protein
VLEFVVDVSGLKIQICILLYKKARELVDGAPAGDWQIPALVGSIERIVQRAALSVLLIVLKKLSLVASVRSQERLGVYKPDPSAPYLQSYLAVSDK